MSDSTAHTQSERELREQFIALPGEARERIIAAAEAAAKLTGDVDEVDPPLAVPLDVDFSKASPPPQWVIEGVLERETVNLWAGDGGSAKSTAAMAAAVAAVSGQDWLGRKSHAERVLYVDEENPGRVPHARLRALGMRNEYKPALRYFNRQGFQLGTPEWDEFLWHQLADHQPGLVFIDGAASATNVEVNENDAVTKLLKGLRAPADEFGCAIVLLHHARKPAVGQSDAEGMSTMGARAWHNQADSHMTFRKVSAFEAEPQPDGGDETRREFAIKGHKVREGGEADAAELLVVTSARTPSKALEWMKVESGGPVTNRRDQMAAEITAFVCEAGRTLTTAQIAEGVGKEPDDSTFERGLKAAHEEDGARIKREGRGKYSPAALAV